MAYQTKRLLNANAQATLAYRQAMGQLPKYPRPFLDG